MAPEQPFLGLDIGLAGVLGGPLEQVIGGRALQFQYVPGLPIHIWPGSAPAADAKADALLVEALGAAAVTQLKNGGAYAVPSKKWKGIEYLVPWTGRVKVMRGGVLQSESCLVTTGNLPAADQMLARIRAIQADETVVYATGNVTAAGPLPAVRAALAPPVPRWAAPAAFALWGLILALAVFGLLRAWLS